METTPRELPVFGSEEDELRFRDEHDPCDYIEGPSDVVVRLRQPKSREMRRRVPKPGGPLETELHLSHLARLLSPPGLDVVRVRDPGLASWAIP